MSIQTSRRADMVRSRVFSLVILFVASTLVWLFAGCASGVVMQNQPTTSLNLLQFAITQSLPRGLRNKSENQREFFSRYFSPDAPYDANAVIGRERAYAHVLILGDMRPYRTDVRVYRERKTSSGYSRAKLDKKLARQVAARIQEHLAKGREERNVIDDFRPF